MILAGFAQLPLTATNAIIATEALIKEYWPEKRVGERKLALNMGVMNVIVTFLGGMPMCHGAGGLAAPGGALARRALGRRDESGGTGSRRHPQR